jgi:hypothetical protein
MIEGKYLSSIRGPRFLATNTNWDKSLKMVLTFSNKMMVHFDS